MVVRASIVALVLAQALSAAPARADTQLTMHNGRVWLRATNATVAEILAAWATMGQVKIINGERLTGARVALQLIDVDELQALDVLLRSVAGYIVTARSTADPNAARFDLIFILPTTSTALRAAATPASPAIPQPSQFTASPEMTETTVSPRFVASSPDTPWAPPQPPPADFGDSAGLSEDTSSPQGIARQNAFRPQDVFPPQSVAPSPVTPWSPAVRPPADFGDSAGLDADGRPLSPRRGQVPQPR
jgi:hypothetical protein